MSSYVVQMLLGLGSGALVAALALGVVLTYKGSGVVNLAHGGMAMYVAYVFSGLRSEGELFVPPVPNPLALVEGVVHGLGGGPIDLPDIPTSVALSSNGLSTAAALPLALVVAAAFGFVVHVAVFRPLRNAPPLAKLVASVGLMLTLQAVVVLRFGSNVRAVPPIIPDEPIVILGTSMGRDRLLLAGLVVAIGVVLSLLSTRTRLGIATRAAAESERTATLVGLSPDFLAGLNWVVATVLAGLVGILASQITQLEPTQLALMIVPAVGAALIGGLSSFGLATAAGLGIGAMQSLVTLLQVQSWYPRSGNVPLPGVAEALPLVVIVGVLFWRGERLPSRGTARSGYLPFSPMPRRVALRASVAAGAAVVVAMLFPFDWRQPLTNSTIGMLLCLSFVVLTGFVGQTSLAQLGLAGIAGFALAKLAGDAGIPFPVSTLLAAVVATAFGLIVALPALRIRGVNLAVVTLAAAVAIEQLLLKNPSWGGGTSGSIVDPPTVFGLAFGPADGWLFDDGKLPGRGFTMFCILVATVAGLAVVNLRRSVAGRRMLAVRANERAAAAAGVDVAATKLLAFGVAAFLAGTAGALYAYSFQSVSASRFGAITGVIVVAFAYLGGISSVTGAVVGGLLVSQGIFFHVLDDVVGVSNRYELLLAGTGLLLTAVLNPDGIAGGVARTLQQRAARDAARSGDVLRPAVVGAGVAR